MGLESIGTPTLWLGFAVFVLAMLALDLGLFHRKAHEVGGREALLCTAAWVALALLFNLGVYFWFGPVRALEFLTGYVIEEALSIDNLFVFIVVFSVFAVPAKVQHRVLYWGILGALVMRAAFIVLGAALLHRFHWIGYLFGAFLVFTGGKLLVQRGGVEVHPERNPIFRLFRRFVPSVDQYRGGRFSVIESGKRYATPLLLVLVAIEATDILFAVDSVPAIFAVTTDPFIVYTSNIFAILSLRALYFVLARMMGEFHYLKVGLSLVLAFVGAKMLLAGVYEIPIVVSLAVIATLLAGAVAASRLRSKGTPPPAGSNTRFLRQERYRFLKIGLVVDPDGEILVDQCLADQRVGGLRALPPKQPHLFFRNCGDLTEEDGELVAATLRELTHVFDVRDAFGANRHKQHSVIPLALSSRGSLLECEHADDAAGDDEAGKAGKLPEDHCVEGVAIVTFCRRDEAPVVGYAMPRIRGWETTKASISPSYFIFRLEPRGVSTTTLHALLSRAGRRSSRISSG